MPVFAYRALGADGGACGGVIGADSLRAARQTLRDRGVYPTDLHEQAIPRWERRPPPAALAAAVRQLATLASAGVPLADALAVVAAQADHPTLVRGLTAAHGELVEGRALADALAASPVVFPPLFSELVRAGETSGALPAVLLRLAEHTEAAAAARARLRATLAYPAVMTLATGAVLVFLLAWVVPEVARLFADAGARLPLATRALLLVTRVTSAAWWLAVVALAAGAWAVRAWAITPAGRTRIDRLVLRLPVVGDLVRRAAVARIARTLAALLDGGVPLASALGIARATAGNRHLTATLTTIGDAVERGEPLAPALEASGEFPPLLVRLVDVGERGGSLPAMLERAATTYEGEAAAAAAGLAALVEPALVLVMGSVVLALVVAILLPLFELNTLVR
jgi:general secretion pathway protein F